MSNKTYTTFLSYIEEVPKEIRIKHCDIHAPCTFKGKNGNDYTTKRRSQESAYENLVSFLIKIGYLDKNLLGKNLGKGKVSVNHLCKSTAGIGNSHDPVCNNPKHLYLGSPLENWHDINPSTNKSALESSIETKNEEFERDIKEFILEYLLNKKDLL